MKIFDIKEVIKVIDQDDHAFANIKVNTIGKRQHSASNFDRSMLYGPGIYAMFYHKELIYIGKHENPHEPVSTRWEKHIQTVTMRGAKAAFSSQKVADTARSQMSNREMIDLIDKHGRVKGVDGVKDGVQVGSNRAAFAHQNWEEFALKNADTLFENFEFHYTQFEKTDGSPVSKKELRDIERILISKHNPVTNFGDGRPNNKIAGIISITDYWNNMPTDINGIKVDNYIVFKPLGNNDLYDHKIIIQNPL